MLLSSIVLVTGCCLSGASAPEPPPSSTAAEDPGCLDLCHRLHDCDVAEGHGDRAADCEAGCEPGGLYASVGETAYHCALEPTCAAARECAGPSLAITLLGSLTQAATTSAPPDWPEGFPTVPGGASRSVPSMGPVRVALLGYAGRDLAEIDRAYRDALTASGWAITDAPSSPEANRFSAAHGTSSVSVSIYREGNDTVVQTMQLGAEH